MNSQIVIHTNKTSSVTARRACSEARGELFVADSMDALQKIGAEIKRKFSSANETLFRVRSLHPHEDDLYWNKEKMYATTEHEKLFEGEFLPVLGRCNDLVFSSVTNLLKAAECSRDDEIGFVCSTTLQGRISGRAGFFDIFTKKPVHEGNTHLWHGMYWLYAVFGVFTVITCMSAVMLGCVIHQGRRAQIVITENNPQDSTTDDD